VTLGAVALDTERGLAVMAGAAGLALLHILHGDLFVSFGVGIEFVVTGGAFLSGTRYMDLMAEYDISTLVLQGDVASSDYSKCCRTRQ